MSTHYPQLAVDDVLACLRYAARVLDERDPPPAAARVAPRCRPGRHQATHTGAGQVARAFALIWSNSAWVIAPLSSKPFADTIWSAAPAEELPATDLMYSV